MKAFKSTLFVLGAFVIGLSVPSALAEFNSWMGKDVDGPDYVRLLDVQGREGYFHTDEVIGFYTTEGSNPYKIVLSSGTTFNISLAEFNALEKQVSFRELQI